MMRAIAFVLVAGCTDSLRVPGTPIGCDPLGGDVVGTFLDPAGQLAAFNPVTATLTTPDTITLTDGTLSLVLGIGTPPRDIDLVFPNRPVLATTGKLIIDEDLACYSGRFVATFQYHGSISGWFAVP